MKHKKIEMEKEKKIMTIEKDLLKIEVKKWPYFFLN